MSNIDNNSTLETTSSPKITLSCEIIEITETNGKTIAKMKFNPSIMKIIVDPQMQYHLGDEITVNARLKIDSIIQNISDAL
jgi:hypothetical protein